MVDGGVEVDAPAFDQPVGVEQDRGPGRDVDGVVHPRCVGAQAHQQVRRAVEDLDVAVRVQQQRWGVAGVGPPQRRMPEASAGAGCSMRARASVA